MSDHILDTLDVCGPGLAGCAGCPFRHVQICKDPSDMF